MDRLGNIVRMHLVDRWSHFTLPWIVLGSAFGVSLAVWLILASVPGASEGDARFSGAIIAIFAYELVLAVQAVNLTFPFALGFGATRREFYLGTIVTFAITGAVNALVLTLLGVLEDTTNGWGVGGRMFTVVWVADGNVAARWFSFFALHLAFVAMGVVTATIYMRWRTNGMVVLWLALGALGVALLALIGYTGSWPAIGAWLLANGTTGVLAWSLLPTALFGLAGWAVLRHATPRS